MYRALIGVSKVFVLIEKAMYRTLLATCGSAEMLAIYNYFKEYKHLKTAEPHEQRAVHFFPAQFAIKNPPE